MNLADRSGETPLTARRKGEYISLKRSKGRKSLGQYMVEGVRALEAALDAGMRPVDLVATPEARSDERIAALLGRVSCPVLTASAGDAARISDVTTSQGVIAALILEPAADATLPESPAPCLVLDGVQDPGNVGTLIRTAAWYGVRTVICGPGTADPFQPKVVRASQGGLWDVRVLRSGDLDSLYATAGLPVHVADAAGHDADLWSAPAEAILVIGSEANGPSAASRKAAAGFVALSRAGAGSGTESLNAAVAAGILMDRWLSRKRDSGR